MIKEVNTITLVYKDIGASLENMFHIGKMKNNKQKPSYEEVLNIASTELKLFIDELKQTTEQETI